MEHNMPKTTLITGANRGIGLALARLAAQRGDRVLATSRRSGLSPELEALAGTGDVTALNLDVTATDELTEAAAAEDTAIDLLVCNAGQYVARGGLEDPEYTIDAWNTVMMTNVAGVFFTVRAFLPRLAIAAEPKIAVISSIMASNKCAPGGSYIYRASKAAATNLARNLAADLKPKGIAVGAYHPGWVRTEMGGPNAEVDAEDSARGLLQRFDALSLATTGVFEDHLGKTVPF
jgi:NAD(P)-dependent dehydrogenase (short-subunit alcohol dehydrogenase family)